MKKAATSAMLGLLLVANASGQGTILWNELVNGPLSNLADSPTSLSPLQAGINSVIASAQATPQGAGWGVDDDIFTLSVPSGLHVTAVMLTVDRSIAAWIGDPVFLSQYGFAINPPNGDLLPQWSLNALSSGSYGIYVSDRDLQPFPTVANYRLDFFVQAIPEPSSLTLALAGTAGLFGLRFWRKFRQR